ncbi:hypothetical protein SAMD00019534_004030 [Acytostelium subglobosum LB1]|uniref:hypothetical protein n=1 Tax=Acytostelium subglobosum LB1 TaxID=1410327 RepID=UPI000644B4BB|nr:hypothetical protein SAMD00019534_004030 [Acytostelium subglobosum LB1]GAM17228.1 hypothetical protein SAMD00019534_004030 [Acytostelium subglobosum LB1]|eukprot:XP_012759290.1 hypothetical protein SAMD00019534_004030 [Acytostelium subglobosum LB1]
MAEIQLQTVERKQQQESRIIIRANRITFSSGAKVGGGHFSIEARWGHASISVGRRIYVFGGQGESLYSNICVYDSTTSVWNEAHTIGKAPSSRYGHSTTLVDNQRVMLFGGRNGKKYLNDLYCLNLPTMSWSTFHFDSKVEPDVRAGHSCTYVPSTSGGMDKMLLFGGSHSGKYMSNPYVLELPRSQNDTIRWIKPTIKGVGPGGLSGHTANLIKDTESIVIFGGYNGKRSYNDIYVLDTKDYIWNKVKPKGISPPARNGHTSVSFGKYIVVHGGCNETNFLNDVHVLDVDTWTWIPQPSIAGLNLFTRFHHTSNLVDTDDMIVYGGCSSGVIYSDMCTLDLKSLLPPPPPEQSPAMASPAITSVSTPNTPGPISTTSTSTSTTTSTTLATSTNSPNVHNTQQQQLGAATPPLQPNSTETITIDYKHHPKHLESQLQNALAMLELEQKQKQLLSNELQQTKVAHTEANQSVFIEKTKYEQLERDLAKLEFSHKKEQSRKTKAQESINKLNAVVKEKEDIIHALKVEIREQQKTSSITSTNGKELAEMVRRSLEAKSLFESQIAALKKENLMMMEQINKIQIESKAENDASDLLEKKFGNKYHVKLGHILGEDLKELAMEDLEKLEEFHHTGLREVGSAKQQLLQKQLLKLQKEKEETVLCLVCVDRSINIVLLPCKHRCLCDTCSNVLKL